VAVFLAPYTRRAPGIAAHLHGILSNPMPEAEASLIPLATVCDFLASPETYNPVESLCSSVARLVADTGVVDAIVWLILHGSSTPLSDDQKAGKTLSPKDKTQALEFIALVREKLAGSSLLKEIDAGFLTIMTKEIANMP